MLPIHISAEESGSKRWKAERSLARPTAARRAVAGGSIRLAAIPFAGLYWGRVRPEGGSLLKKYRAGKIKREHSVIEQLWPALERIAASDLVTSIIPGPISPLNARGFEITFQRFTDTGLRLLAKNGSAIQEVYVVAPEKEATLRWLAAEKIVNWQPPREARPAAINRSGSPEPLKTVTLPSDMECEVCKRLILAGSRAVRMGRKQYYYVHTRCAR